LFRIRIAEGIEKDQKIIDIEEQEREKKRILKEKEKVKTRLIHFRDLYVKVSLF